MSLVDDTSAAITAALEQVGPRLKQVRTQRRITLTGLAGTTGISKSTLSRLENGQRRRVKGRAVIPLTRQPDGMQVWKIVIPTSTGNEPTEILSIFVRPGEKMNVRTT